MGFRPFLDKSNEPTDQTLQAALGNKYADYKNVIELTSSYLHEWVFTESGGWMLKIHDRDKTLLHFIPYKERFKISLTISAEERDSFLRDKELAGLHYKISSSKKFVEGFALQFDTANMTELQRSDLVIQKLITIRA
jgi:hypothetical protein